MFVGHYSAALALKSVKKDVSLGALFVAVQFVDILFFPLAYAGIEKMRIVPHYTASTNMELISMPYTHSLLATFVWGAIAYVGWRWYVGKSQSRQSSQYANRAAWVIALAVMSHWFIDLIVHTPDLSLWGGQSPKLGFGLWHQASLAFALEAVLLVVTAGMYWRVTHATTPFGRYGIWIFVMLLIAANAINFFGAPPTDVLQTCLTAMTAYAIFAAGAFWLDRKRT